MHVHNLANKQSYFKKTDLSIAEHHILTVVLNVLLTVLVQVWVQADIL